MTRGKNRRFFALPVFPRVNRLDEDGRVCRYRLIFIEEKLKKVVLYDLDLPEGKGKQRFTIIDSDGAEFDRIEDDVSTVRMKKQRAWEAAQISLERGPDTQTKSKLVGVCQPKQTTRDEGIWERDWGFVQTITGPRQRIAGRPAYEFYANDRWRKEVFASLEAKTGAKVKYISAAFWQSVRYGGDWASVMSLTDRSGADGDERPARPGRGRTGRPPKPLAERVNDDPDGMTQLWRDRVVALANEQIRGLWSEELRSIDLQSVRAHLKKKTKFFQSFRERYYLESAPADEKANRPNEEMVSHYLDVAVVSKLSVLVLDIEQAMREEKGVAPRKRNIGTTRRRGAGILQTIQMDGTLIGNFMLVQHDPETKQFRDMREPTVVLAARDDPEIIIGWNVTPWPEDGESYRDALYNAFSTPEEKLESLGIDPKRVPGIVRGYGDEVVTDRKPGMKLHLWSVSELVLAGELTLPWTPQQKGSIEGINGRLKRLLDELMDWECYLRSKFPNQIITLQALNKALPKGAAAISKMIAGRQRKSLDSEQLRIETRAFERLLVECIHRLNTRPLTRTPIRTRRDVINRQETPAEIYNAAMERLVGAQVKVKRDVKQLRLAMLETHISPIRNGQIEHKGCYYGIGASVSGEHDPGAELLREFIEDGGTEISYKKAPKRMEIKWLRERGDPVTLRATVKCVDAFGEEAEQSDIDATRALSRWDNEIRDRSDYKPPDDGLINEAKANIKLIEGTIGPAVPLAQQRQSRAAERASRKEAHFNKAFGEVKPTPAKPVPLLPTNAASTDAFNMQEYHSVLKDLYAKLGINSDKKN